MLYSTENERQDLDGLVQIELQNCTLSGVSRLAGICFRWQVLIPLLLLHAGALAAPFYLSPSGLILAFALWIIIGLIGITAGHHRRFAHRAFETYRQVKCLHAICASLARQQGPIAWVRIHGAHHAHADTDADLRTQHFGVFFRHMGWSFLAHRTIGRSPELKKNPADLCSDPVFVAIDRLHLPICLGSFIVLYLLGGMSWLLSAGCFRTVFVMHATWAVNSITHRIGYRSYDPPDTSTNWLGVALLTFGEGWHNNHHRFPKSARQGLRTRDVDFTCLWITLLAKLGLAWNVKCADHETGVIHTYYTRKERVQYSA